VASDAIPAINAMIQSGRMVELSDLGVPIGRAVLSMDIRSRRLPNRTATARVISAPNRNIAEE
jgi:hypothetical protein